MFVRVSGPDGGPPSLASGSLALGGPYVVFFIVSLGGRFFCERGARDPCEKPPVARKIVKKGKNVVSVDLNFELGSRLFQNVPAM